MPVLTGDGGLDLSGDEMPPLKPLAEFNELIGEPQEFELPAAADTSTELPAATDAWGADRERRRTVGPPSTRPPPRDTLPAPPGMMANLAGNTQGESADNERPTIVAPSENDPLREVADRYALGDYMASLRGAELELGRNPDNQQARWYADNSRAYLEGQYASRIGSLDRLFVLAVPPAEVRWLGLDHQAEVLLALLTGDRTVTQVMELCSMDRLDALKTFVELLESGAIEQVG